MTASTSRRTSVLCHLAADDFYLRRKRRRCRAHRDPHLPARLRAGAAYRTRPADPRRLPRRAPQVPHSPQDAPTPRWLGLRLRRGRQGNATTSRRSAAPHLAVPAPLVHRVSLWSPDRGARLEALLLRHPPERPDVLRKPGRASSLRWRAGAIRNWIQDQPWYLFLWRHDPTIQSMLVMLDAIHERFHDIDATTAWARLTDPDDPAVPGSFSSRCRAWVPTLARK